MSKVFKVSMVSKVSKASEPSGGRENLNVGLLPLFSEAVVGLM